MNWQAIDGWLEFPEGSMLAGLAIGKDCLEIGSFKGKSTVAMAQVAKSVLAIDTFLADGSGQTQKSSLTTLDEFLSNIEGYNNIEYKVGRSQDILPTLNKSFDLVFIDGLHIYGQVCLEIKLCLDLIKEDGIFVFHDFIMGQVKQAVVKTFDESKILGVQSLAWVFKRERR